MALKYDLQSIFAVMAWGGGGGGGGGLAPYYDGVSRVDDGSMIVIGYNYRPDVMNGLGVWDTKDGVGNHVNTSSLAEMRWGGSAPQRRDTVRLSPSEASQLRSGDAVDIDRRLKLTVECKGVPPPSDGNYARLANYTRGSGAALARTNGVAESRTNGVAESRDCEAMSDGAMERGSKEVHILSLTFDSFFMSNLSGSSDFARLFPFLLV